MKDTMMIRETYDMIKKDCYICSNEKTALHSYKECPLVFY
jgi:hypothetical protein